MSTSRRRSLKYYENKHIQSFLEKIKSNLENEDRLKKLLNSEEASYIVQLLLEKKYKSKDEAFILELYLTQLKNFADLLKQEEGNANLEYILSKLVKDLIPKKIDKNCFLMRIGEIGKEFFITISGKVIVLIPKLFDVEMTDAQFLKHLNFLYSYQEEYLYNKTIKENLSKVNMNFSEIEIPLPNIDLNNIEYETYLSKINCENIKYESILDNIDINDKKIIKKQIFKIYGYFKVCELSNGSSFGEIALINIKNKRTASIFVKENSLFGILTSDSYNKCIRVLHENIKKDNLSYIHNTSIFRNLSETFFFGKFWNCFVERKINKNNYVFKQGFNRDELYFIKSGEIKLVINNCSYELVNQYISNLTDKKVVTLNDNKKKMNVSIAYYREGEVIGLDDLTYDNKLICSGICISEKLVFFALNIKFINIIFKGHPFALNYFKKVEKRKKDIICQRLLNIKMIFENSIQGKYIRNSSIEEKQIEEIQSYFNYDIIEKKEKKPSKLKLLTNLDKINFNNLGNDNINSNPKIPSFRHYTSKIKNALLVKEKKINMNKNNQSVRYNLLNNYKKNENKNLSSFDKSINNHSNRIYKSFTKEIDFDNFQNKSKSKSKSKNKDSKKIIRKRNKNNELYTPTYKLMDKGVMNIVLYNTSRQIPISRISLTSNYYDDSYQNFNSCEYDNNNINEILKKENFDNLLNKKSFGKISKTSTRETFILRKKSKKMFEIKKNNILSFHPKIRKKISFDLLPFDNL